MITLEMVKTSGATVSIKKVLLNAKEIGTSARVQFEMPTGTEIGETAAIVTFETSTLASLIGKVTSKTGGHVASSLGAVEIILAVHSLIDSPRDRFLFDVGHQS